MSARHVEVRDAAGLLQRVRHHFDESIAAQTAARDNAAEAIVLAASVVADAFASGHKVLLCGNGGSAADCQHVAAEFVSRLSSARERRALPAIALTTDGSILTAQANDYSFDSVFARQVEALGVAGDVLIAISTSGASRNVAEAVDTARDRGLHVIGLFGAGAPLARAVDTLVTVDSVSQQATQECFLAVEHALCELVEELLFGSGDDRSGVTPAAMVSATP